MRKYFFDKRPKEIVKNILHLPLVVMLWIFLESIRLNRDIFVVNLGYKGRITHYITNMELSLRTANSKRQRYLMIFVNPMGTPNHAVRNLYSRYSFIVDSQSPNIVRRSFQIFSVLFRERFSLELPDWQEVWKLEPATTLNQTEIEYGKSLLKKMGVPEQKEFVCLGVKDGAYYATIHPKNGFGQDLAHQVFDSRNVDIKNYLPVANKLALQDIYTIRMGSVVSAPLTANRSPKVIDYAVEFRTELGDLALGALCKFFINGTTGSHIFAAMFNKPCVHADCYIESDFKAKRNRSSQLPNSIMILRRYKTLNQKELSFHTIFQLGKDLAHDNFLLANGIIPIPNTSEEINDAVFELLQELREKSTRRAEYESLQDRFYQNFSPQIPWRDFNMSISEKFLQTYMHLL